MIHVFDRAGKLDRSVSKYHARSLLYYVLSHIIIGIDIFVINIIIISRNVDFIVVKCSLRNCDD